MSDAAMLHGRPHFAHEEANCLECVRNRQRLQKVKLETTGDIESDTLRAVARLLRRVGTPGPHERRDPPSGAVVMGNALADLLEAEANTTKHKGEPVRAAALNLAATVAAEFLGEL